MRKYKDITGMTFGRLTAKYHIGNTSSGNAVWLCNCSCGKQANVKSYSLTTGETVSCGCYRIEKATKHGKANRIPEYKAWKGMKERCCNKNSHRYSDYGGRGISICERWLHSFENFYADMGTRPEGKSLDRINNDGNYEPGNCRWATRSEQMKNRRPFKRGKDGRILRKR